MMDKNMDMTALSLNTVEIPTANANARTVVALQKDGGRVTGYQLSDGQIINKDMAVSLARQGEIAGVGIAHRDGSEYLKSIPDGTESNNLSHLPSV